jgi:tetratricopeptide (TPR) repeat protein
MRRLPVFAAALVVYSLLVFVAAARADIVTLKDGTRLEGTLERGEDGYDLTSAGGKVTRLTATQIKSIERKSQPTPDEAQRRLDSLRRAADNLSDINQILTRYTDFLRQYGKTPQAEEARKDVAQWQDRLDQHMTRVGAKWVTPEELGSLKQRSQEVTAKARDMVAQGRLREAGPLLQQALDVDPKNPSALYLKGVIAFRQDQLGPARKAFEQVAQLVPDHAPTLNNLAVIFWKQKGEAGELKYYDAALLATGPAAGVSGPVAEAVVNNVAEALHALPKDQRESAATKKLVQHFQEREEGLAKVMKQRGLYRWGANWVEGDQLDKLQSKEKEIDGKIKDLEAQFDEVQKRMDDIDRDILDTERTLRRMEMGTVTRNPATGQTGRIAPPRAFQGLQRDLQDLKRERADQEAKVAALRRDAKSAKQELPIQRYAGTQRIIDAEGTPLMAAPAPGPAPAPGLAPAPGPVPAPGGAQRVAPKVR